MRLVRVRYLDHVLFRGTALPKEPELRETVGWVAYEDERLMLLVWDRPLSGAPERRDLVDSGLLLVKPCIVAVEELGLPDHDVASPKVEHHPVALADAEGLADGLGERDLEAPGDLDDVEDPLLQGSYTSARARRLGLLNPAGGNPVYRRSRSDGGGGEGKAR